MQDLWDWMHDSMFQFEVDEDDERLRMAEVFDEAVDLKERDPQTMVSMFQQARNQARSLGETWWAYFYDVWISLGYEEHIGDLQKGLEQATRCVLEGRKPILKEHPWRIAAFNSLLSCYVKLDPIGYTKEIEDTIHELSQEIPPEGSEHRYILMDEHERFLLAIGKVEDAKEVALQHLSLFESDGYTEDWYVIGALTTLCHVATKERDWDALESYAKEAETRMAYDDSNALKLAELKLWQAVSAMHKGNTLDAKRLMRQASQKVSNKEKRPGRGYYEALVQFHLAGDDLEAVLQVREEQLSGLQDKGQNGYECDVYLARCKVLQQLGKLSKDDIDNARIIAESLRQPEAFLQQIDQLELGNH